MRTKVEAKTNIVTGAKIFVKNKRTEKFLFVLRSDLPTITNPGKWGLLGGMVEKGETPFQALKRELKEESNIQVSNIRFVFSEKVMQTLNKAPLPVVGNWFVGETDFDLEEIDIYEGERAEYFTLDQAKEKEDLVPYLRKFIAKHEKELIS